MGAGILLSVPDRQVPIVAKSVSYFLVSGILLFMLGAGCGASLFEEAGSHSGQVRYPAPGTPGDAYAAHSLLLKLDRDACATDMAHLLGGAVRKQINLGTSRYVVVDLPLTMSVEAALSMLEGRPGFILAEPNYLARIRLIPDDARYNEQYSLVQANCPAAWNVTQGTNRVTIAIVDTGVNGNHVDLADNMVGGYNSVYDTTILANSSSDDNGHGTHVAGIAAARGNNGSGVAGVAWKCQIMPIKAIAADGSGEVADIAQGIVWAVDNRGANRLVINMSLGIPYYIQLLQDAVHYALIRDTVVVAASGNEGIHMIEYPAYCPGVIAVGSTATNNIISDFSSRGVHVSVTAPGSGILSTAYNGGYEVYSGTSMATPFVAGAAALVLSCDLGLTAPQVKTILESTAQDLGDTGFDPVFGWGQVDVGAAVVAAPTNSYGALLVNVYDSGLPLGGLEVQLYDQGGVLKQVMRTSIGGNNSDASNGSAVFHFVAAGDYQVQAVYGGVSRSGNVTITTNHTDAAPAALRLDFSLSPDVSLFSTMYLRLESSSWEAQAMTLSGPYTWSAQVVSDGSQDELVFDAAADWEPDTLWGDYDDDGLADISGPGIVFSHSGTVNVTFNDYTKVYTISY